MCDLCNELDAKIERYRRLSDLAMDPMTREAAAKLIAELISEKAKLHAGQDE